MTRLEILQPFVEKTVAAYLGIEEVQVWEDGTIPIRSGTTIVNVRLVEGENPSHPILQVYSPLLSEIRWRLTAARTRRRSAMPSTPT